MFPDKQKPYIGLFVELEWQPAVDYEFFKDMQTNPPPTYITSDGRDTRIPRNAFGYMWKQGLYQTMWYVYSGHILSSTRHGVVLFNEFFGRVTMIPHGAGDQGVLAVEIHPGMDMPDSSATPSTDSDQKDPTTDLGTHLSALSINAIAHARPVISFAEFIQDGQDHWQHPPNSLCRGTVGGVRKADQDAIDRLSALIYTGIYLAGTSNSPSVGNPHAASAHTSLYETEIQDVYVDPQAAAQVDTTRRAAKDDIERCRSALNSKVDGLKNKSQASPDAVSSPTSRRKDEDDDPSGGPPSDWRKAFSQQRNSGPQTSSTSQGASNSNNGTVSNKTTHQGTGDCSQRDLNPCGGSPRDCREPVNQDSALSESAIVYNDEVKFGESCGGSPGPDPRELLLAADVSILPLRPNEMDALLKQMYQGSVRAPSADLHDWFLCVEPSSTRR